MNLNDDITYLKGVGEKRAKLFHKLDIQTVGDLLTHYPRGNVGHSIGVGCAVSEAPLFTKDNDMILEENMVVTLETPYSGTGDALVCGGYNIEDCYLIQKDGAVQFTFAPDCLKW